MYGHGRVLRALLCCWFDNFSYCVLFYRQNCNYTKTWQYFIKFIFPVVVAVVYCRSRYECRCRGLLVSPNRRSALFLCCTAFGYTIFHIVIVRLYFPRKFTGNCMLFDLSYKFFLIKNIAQHKFCLVLFEMLFIKWERIIGVLIYNRGNSKRPMDAEVETWKFKTFKKKKKREKRKKRRKKQF